MRTGYRCCIVKLKAGIAKLNQGRRVGRRRVQYDLKLTLAHQDRHAKEITFRAPAAASGTAAGGPLQQLTVLLLVGPGSSFRYCC